MGGGVINLGISSAREFREPQELLPVVINGVLTSGWFPNFSKPVHRHVVDKEKLQGPGRLGRPNNESGGIKLRIYTEGTREEAKGTPKRKNGRTVTCGEKPHHQNGTSNFL